MGIKKDMTLKQILWQIEKASKECDKRQRRLDESMSILCQYMEGFKSMYPEDYKMWWVQLQPPTPEGVSNTVATESKDVTT